MSLLFQNGVYQCLNISCFNSFTIYYMNALVTKASSLYILKQMSHVSNCFRLEKNPKFWTLESIVSPHNSVLSKAYPQVCVQLKSNLLWNSQTETVNEYNMKGTFHWDLVCVGNWTTWIRSYYVITIIIPNYAAALLYSVTLLS